MPKTLKKLLDCFFLLRIPLLAPVWTIFILGWITGSQNLSPGGCITTREYANCFCQLWLMLAGFSFTVASIYVVNQIVDIENDRINHKLFLLPHGFISLRTAWILSFICAITGLFIAASKDIVFVTIFASSLLLGFLYNLPPFSLKNHAWGGVIANALGHGMLTFIAGWYCAKYPLPLLEIDIKNGFVSSIAPALANGAVFLATTIPDVVGDKKSGKNTFCVKFGSKITAVIAVVLCTGACITSLLMENHYWVMLVPSMVSLPFFVYFAYSLKNEIAFRAFKWPVFLLTASVTFYAPEYGILIFAVFFGSRIYYKWRFNIDYPTFKSK